MTIVDFLQRKARFVIRVARNVRVGKKRARCRAREGMCRCGVDSRWWVCGFWVGTRTRVRAESGDRARRVPAKKRSFEDILAICVSKILWGSHVKRMTLKLCECEIVTV